MRDAEELTAVLLDLAALHLKGELAHRELPGLEHVVEAIALGIELIFRVHIMAPLHILRAFLIGFAALDTVGVLNLREALLNCIVKF